MQKRTIIGLIAIVMVVAVVMFAGCVEQVNTYDKFGFSFDYPADMKVEEKGFTHFKGEVNEEAGMLYLKKPGHTVEVLWMTGVFDLGDVGDVDFSHLTPTEEDSCMIEIISTYFSNVQRDHTVYLGGSLEHIDIESNPDYAVLGLRFVSRGEDGTLLNIIGLLYDESSKRVFTIRSSAMWDDPKFVMVFRVGEKGIPKTEPDWPDLKKDPSYKVYKKVISSFRCH